VDAGPLDIEIEGPLRIDLPVDARLSGETEAVIIEVERNAGDGEIGVPDQREVSAESDVGPDAAARIGAVLEEEGRRAGA
jgi:hypothetical protein